MWKYHYNQNKAKLNASLLVLLALLCSVKKNFSQRQSNNHILWHPRARKGLAVTLSHGMEKKEEKGYRGRAIKMRPGYKGHETYRNFHPARSTFVDISQPVIAFRPARTRITDGRNGPHEISFPYLIPVPTKQREKREDA